MQNSRRPAPFLPLEVMEMILSDSGQIDCLSFVRVCRTWYATGHHLAFETLEVTIPSPTLILTKRRKILWDIYKREKYGIRKLIIRDFPRSIMSPTDLVFDTLSRYQGKVWLLLPMYEPSLRTIREVHILSQPASLRGRSINYVESYGREFLWWRLYCTTYHTWIFNLLPLLFSCCTNIKILELEILDATRTDGIWINRRTPRFEARLAGIDLEGYARADEWPEYPPDSCLRYWELCEPRCVAKLERISLTFIGALSEFSKGEVLRPIWNICNIHGIFRDIETLSIENCTQLPGLLGESGFKHFQLSSLKELTLSGNSSYSNWFIDEQPHCGWGSFETTVSTIKILTLNQSGVWPLKDFEFLRRLCNLKRLEVRETSLRSVYGLELDRMDIYANTLTRRILIALLPPNLRSLRWNVADYDEFYCELMRGSPTKVEYIDVWNKTGRFTPVERGRYSIEEIESAVESFSVNIVGNYEEITAEKLFKDFDIPV